MPSYISIFSILMFNHIFFNILKVLFTSLCSPPFLAVLFGASIHVLPCCAFTSMGCATTLQFHYGFFFPVLYSGHKIFFHSFWYIFSPTTVSFLLYFVYLTLLPSLLSLHFCASKQLSHHIFLDHSSKINPCLWLTSVLILLQSHLLYSTYITTFYLVFYLFSSIAIFFQRHTPCAAVLLCFFP